MTKSNSNTSIADKSNNNEFFIAIDSVEKCASVDDIIVNGKFKILYDENGITTHGSKVLKHIVMVVTRSGNYQALPPFKDVVVFEDDVNEDGKTCSGLFTIKLSEHIVFSGKGDYYILCSIGTYLSNIIKISV